MGNTVFLIIFLLSATCFFPFSLTSFASTPYKDMLTDPVSFTAIKIRGEHTKEDTSVNPIVLGFFLPSSNSTTNIILGAAKQVIFNANKEGGYRGRPLQIINRSADKPWQSGASEILKLIYEDHAAVLFTSLSAESHLASQAAAKAFIPVISILSADSTLNHAGVPWIRRLIPSYELQADVLVEQLLRSGKNRPAVISMTDKESRLAAAALTNALKKSGHPPLHHLQLATEQQQRSINIEKIVQANPDSIFIASSINGLNDIQTHLKDAPIHPPLYLCWAPRIQKQTGGHYPDKLISVSPLPSAGCSNGLIVYGEKQQEEPDDIFKIAYDAVQMTVDAIMEKGPGAAELQESISSFTHYQGKYGEYLFDNGGANISPLYLCEQ